HPAHVYPKKSVARDGFHRLHAVADEVDQNLLDLDAIGRDDRKVAFDIDIHTDASSRRLLGDEVARLCDDSAERHEAPRLRRLREQGTDAADDVCGGIGITNDALHGLLSTFDI